MWKRPHHSSSEGWEAWEQEMRSFHPWHWFFGETLPILYSRYKRRLFHDSWWALQHRFNPRRRYNILRTGLPPNYYDPDTQILHAVMNSVVRFVEETSLTVDWDSDEEHKRVWKILLSVKEWWSTHSQREKDLDPLDLEAEIRLRREEDHNLHKIISVRQFIWYP